MYVAGILSLATCRPKLSTALLSSDYFKETAKSMVNKSEKMASTSIDWTYENIEQLIELYEQRPCLYDTRSKDYFNQDVRNDAIQDIAKVLNTTGKKKINNRSIHMQLYNICKS